MNSTIQKKGYKETKLGWIPVEWEVVKLGNIFSFKNGINASKEDYGKGIKFVNVSEVFNNQFITASVITGSVKVKEEAEQNYSVKRGDILFNRTSETLEEIAMSSVYLDDENVVFGGFVIRARPTTDLLSDDFKKYCFSTSKIRKQMISRGQGAIRTNIGQNDLSKIIIPLPPLPEQQKIADILTTWDTAIESTQALIEQLQIRKKGLMQQLLTGKMRLAGFEGEWEEVRIKDVASDYSVKNINDDELEVLSCTKYDGLVPSLQYFGRRVYGKDLSKYKVVPHGYFAYATNHIEEGSIGYQDLMPRGLISPMYTVFKTNEKVDDVFFFKLLKTSKMIYQYQSNMSGSIARRGGLRWGVFKTIVIKIPPKPEQTAIAQVLSAADLEITHYQTYLTHLQAQKRGLMQQLLTGQKRVKV